MLLLLLTVTVGTAFAVFATQNTQIANINFGPYIISDIPIYLIVLIPLILGLLLAYLFFVLNILSRNLTIDEQKGELKLLKERLAEAEKKSHKLELENVKIRKGNGDFDEDSIH